MVQSEPAEGQRPYRVHRLGEAFLVSSVWVHLSGVSEIKLYASAGSSLIDIPARVVSTEFATWLAIIAPTLLPFITESKVGVVSYNPQRVMRQLEYDQSAIFRARWAAPGQRL